MSPGRVSETMQEAIKQAQASDIPSEILRALFDIVLKCFMITVYTYIISGTEIGEWYLHRRIDNIQ